MRAFAGIHDPRRPPTAQDAARLVDALDGTAEVMTAGGLAVGWVGSPPPDGTPIGFVDGVLYDPLTLGAVGGNAGLAVRFAAEGDRLLNQLRGDFVALFYDERRGVGTLVRDQLGGRSLNWHLDGGRLTFASELRYLLPLLARRPGVDLVAMAHLLAPSGQLVDRGYYDGVHQLPAAHVLAFGSGAGAPVARRYWSPRYEKPVARPRAEHVAGLRARLDEAVRRRSRPGEAVAMLLSGGLDSSTVAGVASCLDDARRPRRAYSATFPEHPSVDEGALIELLCSRLGLAGTRVVVRSGSVLSGALEYLDRWKIPPPSPNLFFWMPLFRRASSDGVETLLDGEGGDEAFGLAPYLIADLLRRGRPRAAVDLIRNIPGGGPHLTRHQIRPFLREFGLKGAMPPRLHDWIRRRRGAATAAPPWLGPEVAEAYLDTDVQVGWKRLPGPRWWANYLETVIQGRGSSMTYSHVRRRAALCGLEMRHPLVDVDVLEFMLTVPPELNFDTRFSRPLIREAMAGVLPDEVRLRPEKSTFSAVFEHSLAEADLRVVRALLDPADSHLGPYVDLGVVADLLLHEVPGPGHRREWAQAVWRLVTAECWLRVAAGTPTVSIPPFPLRAPDLEVVGP